MRRFAQLLFYGLLMLAWCADATAQTYPSLAPRGLTGVGITAEQVNAAIERGSNFLWQHLRSTHEKSRATGLVEDGPDLLSAIALVHCGVHKKDPAFDAQVR